MVVRIQVSTSDSQFTVNIHVLEADNRIDTGTLILRSDVSDHCTSTTSEMPLRGSDANC